MGKDHVAAVSVANTKFGHDLHNVLAADSPNVNLVHSPFSLSIVLAMAKHGARNNTSLEMEKVCHFPKDESLASGYKHLLKALQDANKGPGLELLAANRLYAQHGFQMKPKFVAALQDSFHAGHVQQLNFAMSTDAAKEINDWVEIVTKDKIKNLIPPAALNGLTRLVLVNGIYFKGLWKDQFDKASTTKDSFHAICDGGSTKKVQVDMMHLRKKFPYAELNESRVVGLPYQGEELQMLIILPKEINGLQKLQTTPIDHESLFAQMNTEGEVKLSLPRFRVESTHELVKPLEKMGLGSMFSDSTADFSGITDTPGLYVTYVIRKAFVEVNEEGTEAAAATGMVMGVRSLPQKPKIIDFNVDHPFLFQIIHIPSRMVLFAGCVTNPQV